MRESILCFTLLTELDVVCKCISAGFYKQLLNRTQYISFTKKGDRNKPVKTWQQNCCPMHTTVQIYFDLFSLPAGPRRTLAWSQRFLGAGRWCRERPQVLQEGHFETGSQDTEGERGGKEEKRSRGRWETVRGDHRRQPSARQELDHQQEGA